MSLAVQLKTKTMAVSSTWVWLPIWAFIFITNKIEAVEFATHPQQSASGVQGSTIMIECGINSEYRQGVHRIYWAFYGSPGAHTFLSVDRSIYSSMPLSKRGRYSITGGVAVGETTFNLQIANAQLEDNGRYECIIYDQHTGLRITSKDPTQVVVLPYEAPTLGPICSINPPSPRPGVFVKLTCYTHGGLPRPKITWRRNGVVMQSVLNSTEDAGLEIITTQRSLSTYDNNVAYTCSAEHPTSPVIRNCSITPFVIPIQVSVTKLQSVKVGQSAEFMCTATGVPPVNKYRWIIGSKKISKSEGRFHMSALGNFLKISDITEKDNDISVKCVARNAIDLKGTGEGMLRVISTKPTANVATAQPLTTFIPNQGAGGGKGYDGYPTLGTGAGTDNKGRNNNGRRGDKPKIGRRPGRPNRPRDPRPSGSYGFYTVRPNGDTTMKQRAFDGPYVTYHVQNDIEKINASPRVNMQFLVGGATGLLLIVLIVLLILIVIVRKSSPPKPYVVKSARNLNRRPYSTGTLSKSDIFVLPVPSSDEDERDITKPVGTDGITSVRLISLEKAATLDSSKTKSAHPDFLASLKGSLRSKNNYMSFFENEAVTKSYGRSDSQSSDLSEGEMIRCDSAFCDDYKPGSGLSGSETAINDYSPEVKFFKNKKRDLSKSTGNLVYVELDFGKVKQTTNVICVDDKTHYAEIRMSRNIDLLKNNTDVKNIDI